MTEKTNITLNSSALYVSAFLATTMFHELGHALAGAAFGSSPVMYHNYVEHLTPENLGRPQGLIVALAGPVISLLQGIIAAAVYLRSKKQNLTTLFLLWFALHGLNNFLGYTMTGFLFQQGDIGRSFLLLDVPLVIQIILAVLAAFTLLYVAYRLTRPFLKFSYREEWLSTPSARANFSLHTLILPWIAGSVVVTAVYLPIQAIVSIIYPVMSGFIYIFPWQNARRADGMAPAGEAGNGRLSIASVAVLITILFLFRFILAEGVVISNQ